MGKAHTTSFAPAYVYGSGPVLSLEATGHGAISVPRPGTQHDQRRLRFLHVLVATRFYNQQTVDFLRQRQKRHSSTATSFLRRQTGLHFSFACFIHGNG